MLPGRVKWFGLLVIAGWTPTGRAQSGPLLTEVDYHAPLECPDAATFLQRVSARSPVQPSKAASPLRLRVDLSVSPEGARGDLTASSADGTDTRSVTASSCAEVVDALALIAALAVERVQRTHVERQQAQAQRPEPRRTAAARAEPRPPPGPRPKPTRVDLGLGGAAAKVTTGPIFLGSELSLSVTRGFVYFLSASYLTNALLANDAEYGFGALTVAAAPPSWPRDSAIRASAGLAVRGGFLTAKALDTERSTFVRRSYWALGLWARLSFDITPGALLFLDGSLVAPLYERRFHTLEPDVLIGSTVPLAVGAAAGFALSL